MSGRGKRVTALPPKDRPVSVSDSEDSHDSDDDLCQCCSCEQDEQYHLKARRSSITTPPPPPASLYPHDPEDDLCMCSKCTAQVVSAVAAAAAAQPQTQDAETQPQTQDFEVVEDAEVQMCCDDLHLCAKHAKEKIQAEKSRKRKVQEMADYEDTVDALVSGLRNYILKPPVLLMKTKKRKLSTPKINSWIAALEAEKEFVLTQAGKQLLHDE
jgi:hypothetical protein